MAILGREVTCWVEPDKHRGAREDAGKETAALVMPT